MRIIKKPITILSIVAAILLPISFIIAIHTSAQSYNSPIQPENSTVPSNLHNWTQTVVIDIVAALNCQITGIDAGTYNPQTHETKPCVSYNPVSNTLGFSQQNGGLIGAVGGMIAQTYTHPPASTSTYLSYLGNKFGVVQPSYAQANGLGFAKLDPFINIWTQFRNLAYLAIVVIMVVIGVAIMLRVKMDPRTVMTIENQIPKVIIALLLITFSFAIAGLMIDLMYVGIYLVFNIFTQIVSGLPSSSTGDTLRKISETQRTFNGDNPLAVMNNIVSFIDITSFAAGGVKDIVQHLFATGDGTFIISGAANFLGTIIGGLAGALAFFVIGAAVLIAMFRLWFTLLMAYVYILLDIVLAPLWIILGILPGSQMNFTAWLRDMAANLSSYVVVIGMFLMAKVFMDSFANNSQNVFVAPLIGNPGDATAFGSLIALGFILISPTAVEMMKEAFKAPKMNFGKAVGQGIGAGQKLVGAGVGTLKDRAFQRNRTTHEAEGIGAIAQDRLKFNLSKSGSKWKRGLGTALNYATGNLMTNKEQFAEYDRKHKEAEEARTQGHAAGGAHAPTNSHQEPTPTVK